MSNNDIQEIQLVIFGVNDQLYGINLDNVEELTDIKNLKNASNTSPCITGAIEVRDKTVPVIDLRKRYHLAKVVVNSNNRILVINSNTGKFGIIVDMISELLKIQANSIRSIDSLFIGDRLEHLKGVVKIKEKSIILIDIESIISGPELYSFDIKNKTLVSV